MIKYKVWLAVKLMTSFGEVQTILKRLSFRNLGFNTSPEELESFKYLGRNAVHKNDCIYLDQKLYIEESKEVQGLTAGIHHIHTYTKFYWRMHEFVYAHIDMYTHFSLWSLNCSIFFIFFFCGSCNTILSRNLLLYIWHLICLSLEETDCLHLF